MPFIPQAELVGFLAYFYKDIIFIFFGFIRVDSRRLAGGIFSHEFTRISAIKKFFKRISRIYTGKIQSISNRNVNYFSW